jgi:membrane protein DedA with SNARE-associated domain
MLIDFIMSYGYFAVFAGTLLEGETILIAAGYAAHRGMLDWKIVYAAAFAGATLGDQMAFLIGRWKGNAIIARFPKLSRNAKRVQRLFERHHTALILVNRFIYGLRIAGPLVMGSSRVPIARFAALNMIGAAVWAGLIGGAGYAFGVAIEAVIAHMQRVEEFVLIGIFAAGLAAWVWRRTRS